MERDIFAPTRGEWLGEKGEERRNKLLPAAAAAIVALALAGSFLLGARHGSAPIAALERTKQSLQAQVIALQSQVTVLQHQVQLLRERWGNCTSYTADFRTITRLIGQGHFAAAASVANLDLSNRHARPCDALGLAQLWYTASIDALTGSPPTGPDDTTSILTWDSINARATAFGLPPEARTSPLTLIAITYNAQNWALCRYIFTQVWGNLIGPADRLQVVTYYSATRNEGRALATTFTGAKREEGLRLLATAAAIGTPYVHRGEAAADLTALLGPGWAHRVAPDAHDPILQSLRSGR
jgi:hypothetical protein